MSQSIAASFQGYALALLRIVAGFMFCLHGVQKLFGLLGGKQAELFSVAGFAGVLEFFGGILIMLGLLTVPTAFILSGQMAVAYFWRHFPQGFWPLENRGELAALYSFIFLYLFTAGPGRWSLDGLLKKKR